MYMVKKRLVWVVLERGERDKNNETGLKEGGGIQILTTVHHSRAAPSLKYSPISRTPVKERFDT